MRVWFRKLVARWQLYLGLCLVGAVALLVIADYTTNAWDWVITSEDLGARLRRECESVARETLRQPDLMEREFYIRDCINSRARLAR